MNGLELLGVVVQFLATVTGAAFGVIAALSKRKNGKLKPSDRAVLYGIVVSAVLAVTALTVDVVRQQRVRAAETVRISEELSRQNNLLRQVYRGLYGIVDYNIGLRYTLPANHPALLELVSRWDAYLTSSAIATHDADGYSNDKTLFIVRDHQADKSVRILRLAVDAESDLFPRETTSAYWTLLPGAIYLLILKQSCPNALARDPALFTFDAAEQFADLALFIPLNLAKSDSAKEGSRVSATLVYDVKKQNVNVEAVVRKVTATWSTGAIISLLDLPGRELALIGFKTDRGLSFDHLKFTANPGGGRFWSGHKQIMQHELKAAAVGKNLLVTYCFTPGDFDGLAAIWQHYSEATQR